MPALVGLAGIGLDGQPVAARRDLRPRHVQVDRQQTGGPHEQVVGEDRVDRADPATPRTVQT